MGTRRPTEKTTNRQIRLNLGMCNLTRTGRGKIRINKSEKMFNAAWLKYSAVRSKQCHRSLMTKMAGWKTSDGL